MMARAVTTCSSLTDRNGEQECHRSHCAVEVSCLGHGAAGPPGGVDPALLAGISGCCGVVRRGGSGGPAGEQLECIF